MRRAAVAIPLVCIAAVVCCGKPAASPDEVPIAAPVLDASAVAIDAPTHVVTITKPEPPPVAPEDDVAACVRLLESLSRCFPPGLWPPPGLGDGGLSLADVFTDPEARKTLGPLCAFLERLTPDAGGCP